MKIIGLVGFAGSGKNTVGNILASAGFKQIAFADCLKDALAAIFLWDREMLQGETSESRVWREQVDPWWSEKLGIPHFTPRWAMSNIGTNLLRQQLCPDIWLLTVERRILNLTSSADVVITDVRFPNEIDFIKRMGGSVARVKRGPEPNFYELALRVNTFKPEDAAAAEKLSADRDYLNSISHPSEYAWIGHPIDGTIVNDGTIDDLVKQVDFS